MTELTDDEIEVIIDTKTLEWIRQQDLDEKTRERIVNRYMEKLLE